MNTNKLTADQLSLALAHLSKRGGEQIKEWMEGRLTLDLPDDEIELVYDRWRDDDCPNAPMWDDVTEKTRDQMRDAYLEAAKLTCAQGLSLPVPSVIPSPVSRSAVMSLFREWWSGYMLDPQAGYGPEEKEDHMAEAFLGGFDASREKIAILQSQVDNHNATLAMVKSAKDSQIKLLREKLKDCESALERTENASPASSGESGVMEPGLVKEVVEALEEAYDALQDAYNEGYAEATASYGDAKNHHSHKIAWSKKARIVLTRLRSLPQGDADPSGVISGGVSALGEVEKTPRGFEIIRFKDRNGDICELQQSSIADFEPPGSSAIWLGLDKADRMHISVCDVGPLVAHLNQWLLTGSFDLAPTAPVQPSVGGKQGVWKGLNVGQACADCGLVGPHRCPANSPTP